MRQQSGDVVLNDILSQGGIAAAREFDLGDKSNIAKLFDICESDTTLGSEVVLAIGQLSA